MALILPLLPSIRLGSHHHSLDFWRRRPFSGRTPRTRRLGRDMTSRRIFAITSGVGSTSNDRLRELVERLNLAPHPERGFFVETYRASTSVAAPTHGGPRAASTAIYYLIGADAPATYLHRLLSDEVFHLYEGGPLEILLLRPDGRADVARLGLNLAAGERPQLMVPAGTWFGTELGPGASHCLVGCTVAPGFEFGDFALAEGPELALRYPQVADRIARMTRPRPPQAP
jgi:predicted cupin superfamily sugar epimerase